MKQGRSGDLRAEFISRSADLTDISSVPPTQYSWPAVAARVRLHQQVCCVAADSVIADGQRASLPCCWASMLFPSTANARKILGGLGVRSNQYEAISTKWVLHGRRWSPCSQ